MRADVTSGTRVGEHRRMPTQFDPPSGTRDFLAAELETRERAFAIIHAVYSGYGFEPLQTPAFERLDVLLGKYGDEGDKLVFKILRRGEHEASGEADLALRYDLTVPLARVAAAYGSQLPSPYKRYAIGSVWRADRPGKGRYREFVQCDLDTLGSTSLMADAEVLCAQHDVLGELGLRQFTLQLNSRLVLSGLLEGFGVPADLGPGVLATLDKLDKLAPADVRGSIAGGGRYDRLIADLGGPDLPGTGGSLGIERILQLMPGGQAGRRRRLDVAVTVMSDELAGRSFALAGAARAAGLRAGMYLGSSGKLGRQLKWASDQGARWCLIYGAAEDAAGTVTVRDMDSKAQSAVPVAGLTSHLAGLAAARPAKRP